jgi:hypothetical protein
MPPVTGLNLPVMSAPLSQALKVEQSAWSLRSTLIFTGW